VLSLENMQASGGCANRRADGVGARAGRPPHEGAAVPKRNSRGPPTT